jgi:hypothetical protein
VDGSASQAHHEGQAIAERLIHANGVGLWTESFADPGVAVFAVRGIGVSATHRGLFMFETRRVDASCTTL